MQKKMEISLVGISSVTQLLVFNGFVLDPNIWKLAYAHNGRLNSCVALQYSSS
jgi:hypothetical protein